jgi:single-strand DNA-binding protein
MIKLMLTGVLGNDCEIRVVGNRKAINLTVAVNQDYKDHDGHKVEKTEWVKAVLWKNSDQSTKVTEFLKKGQKVFIEGIPTSEGYESKDGNVKSSLIVTVKDIELLSSKN